ncbi:MAG: adenylylsulfate kinase [Christensenella sp.]
MKTNTTQLPSEKQISFDKSWIPPTVPENIAHGDMPGDKVQINQTHIIKANTIFKELMPLLQKEAKQNPYGRVVVTVYGGSGVGKSEIASLLTYYLHAAGIEGYTLSGDNYPYRIPKYNDAERIRVFRAGGAQGLVTSGAYTSEISNTLIELQKSELDADSNKAAQYPWLSIYQEEGRKALRGYLGTNCEENFAQLTEIVSQFKNGANKIWLKRMGREDTALWYENVDFTLIKVLVIEWTHGNSDYYQGVDIPILLNSTPQETQEHRKARGRDGKTDSAFTSMVLGLEQQLLQEQSHKAKIIVEKNGNIISYEDYRCLMAQK